MYTTDFPKDSLVFNTEFHYSARCTCPTHGYKIYFKRYFAPLAYLRIALPWECEDHFLRALQH